MGRERPEEIQEEEAMLKEIGIINRRRETKLEMRREPTDKREGPCKDEEKSSDEG